jgi:glutamine amidotransferase
MRGASQMSDGRNIIIIDYGMGNITSVAMALDYLGTEYVVSDLKEDIRSGSAYILPGVGAFPAAMAILEKRGIIDLLTVEVLERRKPFLGICLGMQLIAESSTEKTFTKGFGWINGCVEYIKAPSGHRVPHVGWNDVKAIEDSVLFENMTGEKNFYFDHSYRLNCNDEIKIATCEYGIEIVAAIRKENIFATQFHPEKSQRNGLKLMRNFLNFIEREREKC